MDEKFIFDITKKLLIPWSPAYTHGLYLRMNSKLDQIDRMVKRGGGRGRGSGGSNGALETLAQESFDILTLIPTYIENTKEAIGVLSEETKVNFSTQ